MNPARLAYQPVATLAGALAGMAAGAVVDRAWRAMSGADDVPRAMDEQRHWGEILAAAALQGAVFAVVRALVQRASATGVRRFTGQWPG
jgi:hypothetical protein